MHTLTVRRYFSERPKGTGTCPLCPHCGYVHTLARVSPHLGCLPFPPTCMWVDRESLYRTSDLFSHVERYLGPNSSSVILFELLPALFS